MTAIHLPLYFVYVLFAGTRDIMQSLQMLDASHRSVKHFEPGCNIDIVTDLPPETIRMHAVLQASFHQCSANCMGLPWVTKLACIQLHYLYLREGNNVIFVENDEIFISHVHSIFQLGFNVAFTLYDAHYLRGKYFSHMNSLIHRACPSCVRPSLRINTGIVFIRNVSSECLSFFKVYVDQTLLQETRRMKKGLEVGGVNQEVLMSYIQFSSHYERIMLNGITFLSLPAYFYNHARYYTPAFALASCRSYGNDELQDIKMFHFNKVKGSMLTCFPHLSQLSNSPPAKG